MTYSIYIDHFNYGEEEYRFQSGDKSGEDVVGRHAHREARFVCNSYAKISKGDIYEFQFTDELDALAFRLRVKYKIIPNHIVEDYKRNGVRNK